METYQRFTAEQSGNICDLKRDGLLISLQCLQLLLFIIGASVRYFKYRETGLYSREVRRPTSYKFKQFSQAGLVALCLAKMIILLSYYQFTQDCWQPEVMLFLQAIIWLISMVMMKFEYQRALGHKWYLHYTFWIYSFAFYLAQVCLTWKKDGAPGGLMITMDILSLCMVVLTLFLVIMGFIYKFDYHYERRNYMIDNEQDQVPFEQEKGTTEDHESRHMSELQRIIPLITAKVSKKINIDSNRVLFQVITMKNGTVTSSVKKTYNQFQTLDQGLDLNYAHLVAREILTKTKLPPSGNLNSIQQIEEVGDQLNDYLQAMLKVSKVILADTPGQEPPKYLFNKKEVEDDGDIEEQKLLSSKKITDSQMNVVADTAVEIPLLDNHFRRQSSLLSGAKFQKQQGYIPRELLQFLGLEDAFIEQFLIDQRGSLPSGSDTSMARLSKPLDNSSKAMISSSPAADFPSMVTQSAEEILEQVLLTDLWYRVRLDNTSDHQVRMRIKPGDSDQDATFFKTQEEILSVIKVLVDKNPTDSVLLQLYEEDVNLGIEKALHQYEEVLTWILNQPGCYGEELFEFLEEAEMFYGFKSYKGDSVSNLMQITCHVQGSQVSIGEMGRPFTEYMIRFTRTIRDTTDEWVFKTSISELLTVMAFFNDELFQRQAELIPDQLLEDAESDIHSGHEVLLQEFFAQQILVTHMIVLPGVRKFLQFDRRGEVESARSSIREEECRSTSWINKKLATLRTSMRLDRQSTGTLNDPFNF